jgi:hypothetical protein
MSPFNWYWILVVVWSIGLGVAAYYVCKQEYPKTIHKKWWWVAAASGVVMGLLIGWLLYLLLLKKMLQQTSRIASTTDVQNIDKLSKFLTLSRKSDNSGEQ